MDCICTLTASSAKLHKLVGMKVIMQSVLSIFQNHDLYSSHECHRIASGADKMGEPKSFCLFDAQLTLQVLNLTKIGAVQAFIHERDVLKALQKSTETLGSHVLPKLVVSSSKYDSATVASIVTEAVVSQVSRGTFAVLVMCKGGIPLCVLLASQNIRYIL